MCIEHRGIQLKMWAVYFQPLSKTQGTLSDKRKKKKKFLGKAKSFGVGFSSAK